MTLSHLIKQKSYERVEYVLRRHALTFLPIVFLFLLMLAVPFVLAFLLQSLFPRMLAGDGVFFPLFALGMSGYALVALIIFYTEFTNYYLDIWIVTNDRMIDAEQLGLFSRTVTEIDLFRIQDITTDVHGIFATLFNYGNVTVTTASATANIVLRNVANPNHIRNELMRLAHEDSKYHQLVNK